MTNFALGEGVRFGRNRVVQSGTKITAHTIAVILRLLWSRPRLNQNNMVHCVVQFMPRADACRAWKWLNCTVHALPLTTKWNKNAYPLVFTMRGLSSNILCKFWILCSIGYLDPYMDPLTLQVSATLLHTSCYNFLKLWTKFSLYKRIHPIFEIPDFYVSRFIG